MLFYYLSSGIKTCRNRNHWQCTILKGWMWKCWVGEFNSLRVWHLRSRKSAFLFLVYNPFLHVVFTAWASHIQTLPVSSSSDVMVQKKNGSFLSCYFKSNEFLFGSCEIYANVWAVTQLATHGPTPWKDWEGWRHIFQPKQEKAGASIYKTDTCVCIWEQAAIQCQC